MASLAEKRIADAKDSVGNPQARPEELRLLEALLFASSETLGELPGRAKLRGTGLLDSRRPSGFSVPAPTDDPALRDDEDPLEIGDLELAQAPAVEPEKNGGS